MNDQPRSMFACFVLAAAATALSTSGCAVDAGTGQGLAPVEKVGETARASTTGPAFHYRRGPVVDFTGDAYADYADTDLASGSFWVHRNLENGTFDGQNWAVGHVATGTQSWETLVGDFTGDGIADYADHSLTTGDFYVHKNLGTKTSGAAGFDTGNWGHGVTTVNDHYETLVADFTGDGFVDYADHNLVSGAFYVHANHRDGTFDPWGTNWGSGTTGDNQSYETLVADFDGDGWADFADRNRADGTFYIHRNRRDRTFDPQGTNWGTGHSTAGATWMTLVGDFTGDHCADYADYDVSTGKFWIHANRRDGTFSPNGADWGAGQAGYGWNLGMLGLAVPANLIVAAAGGAGSAGHLAAVGAEECNVGMTPAGRHFFFMFYEGQGFGGEVDGLAPGACRSYTIAVTLASISSFLDVAVDSNQEVPESNESDNGAQAPVIIVPPPPG